MRDWIVNEKPRCYIDLSENTVRIPGSQNICFQLLEKDKNQYRDVQDLKQKTKSPCFITADIEDSHQQTKTYLTLQFSRYDEKSSGYKPPTCERHPTLSNTTDTHMSQKSFLPHKLLLAAIFLGIFYYIYSLYP